jgi:hypothetical protein
MISFDYMNHHICQRRVYTFSCKHVFWTHVIIAFDFRTQPKQTWFLKWFQVLFKRAGICPCVQEPELSEKYVFVLNFFLMCQNFFCWHLLYYYVATIFKITFSLKFSNIINILAWELLVRKGMSRTCIHVFGVGATERLDVYTRFWHLREERGI